VVDELEGDAVIGQDRLDGGQPPEQSERGGRDLVLEAQIWKLVE
jgi:hypothetical protein